MSCNIYPTAFRVLILPDPDEDTEYYQGTDKDFKFELPKFGTTKLQRQAANHKGVVLALGPTAFKAYDIKWVRSKDDHGPYDKQVKGKPWVKVGDHVSFTKYGGKFIEHVAEDENGKLREFILLNDEDITAVLTDESYTIEY